MINLYLFFKNKYFLFSVVSLFFSIIIVHLTYIVLIIPSADYVLSISSASGNAAPRTLSIILKDPEQEICIILFLWSTFFVLYNFMKCEYELENIKNMSTDEYAKYFFGNNNNKPSSIDNTIESLFDVLQMDLSFIKFISWAIPSIGFLGTVRGIGDALGKANEAVLGNITSMTSSLGVAFNSTFIALLLSIFLMFIISRLELKQDELIFKLRSKSY
tara:strand:- start:3188 stop:3838 length:651 start_codon:yes stop_codon:yes gene_type:complete